MQTHRAFYEFLRFSTESSRKYADICLQGNFNMDVRNNMITNDRRIEMAIVALRQRNRYKQAKRLKLDIPDCYKVIYGVRLMPKSIQEELLDFPETVQYDSSYESDSAVLKKYKDNSLDYIISKNSPRTSARKKTSSTSRSPGASRKHEPPKAK